jgi:hypothetical protein
MSRLRWSIGVDVLVVSVVVAAATPVFAQEPSGAGRIKVVEGSAFIVRQGGTIPAQAGEVVYETDGLKTGADGRIGVTLKDDTRVSLGPSSELTLQRFVYDPGRGSFGMILQFVRGVAAYVSGRMAKLSPESIRLETPAAIVGVRGTSLAIRVDP